MLTISVTDTSKTFEEIFLDYDLELSKEIVFGVCKAIDEELASVTICEIITPNVTFYISACRSTYLQTLQVNMERLIPDQEYELCALAQRYIRKIKGQALLEDAVEN